MGRQDFECTPWGNPTYNIFGWQKPCYLLQDGYAATFQELMEDTAWENYGHRSGNLECAHCMVHCGYEATAVDNTFGCWKGFARTVKLTLLGLRASKPVPKRNEESAVKPLIIGVGADPLASNGNGHGNGHSVEPIPAETKKQSLGCGSGGCSCHHKEEVAADGKS